MLGPREAREDLLGQCGLVTEQGDRTLAFYHFSIQEFLAAERIFELRLDQLHDVFVERWSVANWRNTLSFLFGRYMDAFTVPTRPLRLLETLIDELSDDSFEPQTVAGDCAEMLQAEGYVISEEYGSALRAKLARSMTLRTAASERCEAGSLLGKLGDLRFDATRWYLPVGDTLGFEMVEAGPFLMGSDPSRDSQADDKEQPKHEVLLPAFYIGRFPVTVAQFGEYLEVAGAALPKPARFRGVPNYPAVNVSWHEALGYCQWLTGRLWDWPDAPPAVTRWLDETIRAGWVVTLPSEAEWEKAARGTQGAVYPWGDAIDPNKANTTETGIGQTSPVGAFPEGKSPYGAFDMSGNVWEWTSSLWGEDVTKPLFPYPYAASDGRENLTASNSVFRVVRGGSWLFNDRFARTAYRFNLPPAFRVDTLGFRVVVSRSRS